MDFASVPERSSGKPPRQQRLSQKYGNPSNKITTLMLRNIPHKYTQDMLLDEVIDCMGSTPCFDFFYLPWDYQNDGNVGYAFVNFSSVESAERCTRIFTNFSFRRCESQGTCRVYPAHIQGLENNVRHVMDTAVSQVHTHYPIIIWNGEKIKAGKVIEALDADQLGREWLSAPASAPGRMSGVRDINALPARHGMPAPFPEDGLFTAGTAFQHESDISLEVSSALRFSGKTLLEHVLEQSGVQHGNSVSQSSRHGMSVGSRMPLGLDPVRNGRRHAPEIDVLDANPSLREALLRQRMVANSGGLGAGAGMGGEFPIPSHFRDEGNAPASIDEVIERVVAPASMPARLADCTPRREMPTISGGVEPLVIEMQCPDEDVLRKFLQKFPG